jgi:hypothetical protein
LNGGHYIAYIRKQLKESGDEDSSGAAEAQWFYFSDSHFSRVSDNKVFSAQAYPEVN